jgi:hypothetical protein
MKPTLLVLAAGMGSRYGGLKQLDPMGPGGETILDYSVFDAQRAGFGKVVFVIRRDFEQEFREKIGRKYEDALDVDYVFQQLDLLPPGFSVPEGRQKPWGTTHAVWCAASAVHEPFAAINADDFYGADAYRQLAGFLTKVRDTGRPHEFAMVGFRLGNTLSEHGTVARGVCAVSEDGMLREIVERTAIEKTATGAQMTLPDGTPLAFTGDEPVSMNFWGFTPAVFPLVEEVLLGFLKKEGRELKSESYIPMAVAEMIQQGQAKVRVLPTSSSWFGVTYREDKPIVMDSIRKLTDAGTYPQPLWGRKTAEQ